MHLEAPRRRISTGLFALCIAIIVAGAGQNFAPAQETDRTAGAPVVLVADLVGAIGPATAHHVSEAIADAEAREAEALVLLVNTPGGLVTSMRAIIETILASRTPVVAYVSPPGGHAASAGTYILYASHVAAMAPGTNVGAATPVQIGGFPTPSAPGRPAEDRNPAKDGNRDTDGERDDAARSKRLIAPDDPMTAKAVNDAVAYIRSLAELRDRNADWAERAVREAASLSALAALEEGVIDRVAPDLETLLAEIDGARVATVAGDRALRTADARIERHDPSFVTRLLAILANPNVAFLLMMIGVYGLFFELANPGIGPGVPGAICLVLGLYALNQLPLDHAGLALVLLGLAFMAAEALTPAFGILGLGGIIAFSIGATMLIDTDVPEYQVSRGVIAVTAGLSALVLIFMFGFVWRAHRGPVRTGRADLLGASAEVLDWSDGRGHVWLHGERWQARGAGAFAPGDIARIHRVDGLVLTVVHNGPATLAERRPA